MDPPEDAAETTAEDTMVFGFVEDLRAGRHILQRGAPDVVTRGMTRIISRALPCARTWPRRPSRRSW